MAMAVFAALAAAAACSGDRPRPRTARPSLLEGAKSSTGYRSPAVWRYHPRDEAPLVTRFDLPDGHILLAGDRGERWLVDKGGHAQAAARLAPEKLVSILKRGDSWVFVGQSGTTYEAEEPLGAFVRSSAPLDRLARVSAAGTAIIGVDFAGRVLHSGDGGASWQAVTPAGTRFVDVALEAKGRGLALSVPEALWKTSDSGASVEEARRGSGWCVRTDARQEWRRRGARGTWAP